MSPTTTEYEIRAQRIADELGLVVTITPGPTDKCPTWGGERPRPQDCPRCGGIHGRNYWVTIARKGKAPRVTDFRHSLSFDFWGSYADAHRTLPGGIPKPIAATIYAVLACVASDARVSSPRTPPPPRPDRSGSRQAIAVAKFAARLQRFFTSDELAKLAEVDG